MKEVGNTVRKKTELCPLRGRCVIGGNFLPFHLHVSVIEAGTSLPFYNFSR